MKKQRVAIVITNVDGYMETDSGIKYPSHVKLFGKYDMDEAFKEAEFALCGGVFHGESVRYQEKIYSVNTYDLYKFCEANRVEQ